jgi:regulator of sigma E protease
VLISILSFVVVFTIIALAHEFGHLIWAKRAGIRVFEFGIGFGPRLYAFNKNNTTYSLNLIPILAFVRIAGEGESEEDLTCPEEESYLSKTPLQKFKALAAGPFMNILAALLILILLFLFAGAPSGVSNIIGSVNKNSPAEKAGLKIGDKLLAINGKPYEKMEEAITVIHKSADKSLTLSIQREGKKLLFRATPKYNQKMKVALLGFAPQPIYKRVNPLVAVYLAFQQTASMIAMTLLIIWQLLTGAASVTDLAGPIGIAQITGRYAQTGIVSLMWLTAFISVNIGVLNLLPIPALDGGHIVFIIIQAIRKKPIDPKLENKIHMWGMVALLCLMAVVSVGDLLRIFKR